MLDSDEMDPEEIAFTQRINEVFLRKQKMSFDEVVRQYRQIEAEFVERAGDNEHHVIETKRRITEWLLSEAHRERQPYEECRAIFEELVQRGFSDAFQRQMMSGIYVRCCQRYGEFEAGLAVIEPLIAEVEHLLEDATLPPDMRAFWEDDLTITYKRRDELKAGIRK